MKQADYPAPEMAPRAQKLAELIVKECILVGRTAFLNDNSKFPIFPTKQIKQHFGVEE